MLILFFYIFFSNCEDSKNDSFSWSCAALIKRSTQGKQPGPQLSPLSSSSLCHYIPWQHMKNKVAKTIKKKKDLLSHEYLFSQIWKFLPGEEK